MSSIGGPDHTAAFIQAEVKQSAVPEKPIKALESETPTPILKEQPTIVVRLTQGHLIEIPMTIPTDTLTMILKQLRHC